MSMRLIKLAHASCMAVAISYVKELEGYLNFILSQIPTFFFGFGFGLLWVAVAVGKESCKNFLKDLWEDEL
jgi:hypothetical protein